MQKIFRRYVIMITTAAILSIIVINFFLTKSSLRNHQKDTFQTKIGQVIHTMENNQTELQLIKTNLNEDYLTRARAAAYVLEKNADDLKKVSELKNLASLLDVDELHIVDGKGVIRYSSVPKYIGIDFHDGEQTRGFLPILESDSEDAYIVQESQPNTAEGKIMKYVGVARHGEKGIVQIGLKPTRQLEAQERNTYDYIFSRFPTDEGEELFAINMKTNTIIGYSRNNSPQKMGVKYDVDLLQGCQQGKFVRTTGNSERFVLTRQYGDVLIGASVSKNVLYQDLWRDVGITFIYLIAVLLLIILVLNYFLERKVVRGIHSILNELSAITNGNLDTKVAVGGNPEFEELSRGINKMVKSIVHSSNRLSKIIEISGIPLAAFECSSDMKQVFVTSGIGKLLNLSKEEMALDKTLFLEKIKTIMAQPIPGESDIYETKSNRYVRIHLSEKEGNYLGVVTDATKNVLISRKMKYENDHDQLTGLCCYPYFNELAGQALENREPDQLCAAVMLDMDGFKSVNDTYGHDWGDRYLKHFAHILKSMDSAHCYVARRSGDEFCMFIYGYTQKQEIVGTMNDLWERLEKDTIQFPEGMDKKIQISAGYSVAGDLSPSLPQLLREADEALYRAKRAGKGIFAEYGTE